MSGLVEPGLSEKRALAEPQTSVSLSWLMLLPTGLSTPDNRRLVRRLIADAFDRGAEQLGFAVARDSDSDELPCTLMRTDSGFELRIDRSLRENTIHPDDLEGAGFILPKHGHQPLLMLVYLQQQYAARFPDRPLLVTFCDEQGDTFRYTRFELLKPLIERLGFCHDATRADAERLGLVPPRIRLDEIDSDQENLFF